VVVGHALTSDGAATPSDCLLVASTAGITTDAAPLEGVLILRDPTAALVWAVEERSQGALDLGIDGYEAHLTRIRNQADAAPPEAAPDMLSLAYPLDARRQTTGYL
jgi:hypothetical protein